MNAVITSVLLSTENGLFWWTNRILVTEMCTVDVITIKKLLWCQNPHETRAQWPIKTKAFVNFFWVKFPICQQENEYI